MKDNELYKGIVAKLGCEPKDYKFDFSGYEDDSKENPFDVLTIEELDFLRDNKCFYLE